MTLTEEQQDTLARMHDVFDAQGVVVRIADLADQERADLLDLWHAGEVTVHPPGPFEAAEFAMPSPRSRPH